MHTDRASFVLRPHDDRLRIDCQTHLGIPKIAHNGLVGSVNSGYYNIKNDLHQRVLDMQTGLGVRLVPAGLLSAIIWLTILAALYS